ncbi:MbtH family protein [Lentzea kentuckyensis]|uniref:MbtH family protein n=1 Tax=Lentzea kentuckyensis TaxID=360086 RepID=UPI002481E4DF|nr:MbtH family protein [Lentzea kentuckyensis]
MTNPFEDENRKYLVLVNHLGQHSLWPVGIDVPAGWRTVFGEAARDECLGYVDEHWSDLTPVVEPA